jgi:hypothetical protein
MERQLRDSCEYWFHGTRSYIHRYDKDQRDEKSALVGCIELFRGFFKIINECYVLNNVPI